RMHSYSGLCGGLAVRIRFFFQAEDGIRDRTVTGVQTCALPIWPRRAPRSSAWPPSPPAAAAAPHHAVGVLGTTERNAELGITFRSEERRVGKECRSRGSPDQKQNKKN